MTHVRTPRRLLAASVTAVLAVTAAGFTAPAVAAPLSGSATPAAASTTQQDAISLPRGSVLLSSGPEGVLTSVSGLSGTSYHWTRYEGGSTTELGPGPYLGSLGTNLAVTSTSGVHTLRDLATGAAPIVIDTTGLGAGAALHRLAGSTLVMGKPNGTGGTEVHLVSKPADTVLDRKVTGLPANASVYKYDLSSPDTLILTYSTVGTAGTHLALVDVATGAVVEDRTVSSAHDAGASATHVAWTETDYEGAVTLAVARRGDTTTAPSRVPLGSGNVLAEPLGDDWVTYGATTWGNPNPLYGLTARSLTTGRTVKLLDSMQRIVNDGGGEQLVQGATTEHGDGLYRISLGQDGTPVAMFVATTGEPVPVGAVTRSIPAVVDFSSGRDTEFRWDIDRGYAMPQVQLTHTASGKTWTSETGYLPGPGAYRMPWSGGFDDHTSASNGDYTWRLTVTPADGVGPKLVKTGTFKVASKPALHDFSDSGAPDLLVRDGSGRLTAYDGRQTLFHTGRAPQERTDLGTGWNTYDQVEAVGNIGGAVHADVIGRDKAGVLWLHQGTGKGLASRTRIGAGWQVYHQLAGGSDLTNDGKADLVATDKAGDLYLYKGTGNATAPFAPRKKIGWSWGIYDQLIAVGDFAGMPSGSAGDLFARDKAGVLWLYLGNGDGTFAARKRIGGGWNQYTDIVGVGDADRNGVPDLIAQGREGGTYGTLFLYQATPAASFYGRATVGTPNFGPGPLTFF